MTTPARDAAPAEREQGIGPRLAATPPSSPAAAVDAAIARLRQSVRAWMDGDRIVPADGASLLAALGQAQEGLLSRDRPAARAALAAFVSRVQALIDAGVLATGDGQPPTEAAALLAASLRSAGGMDG